MYSLEFGTSIEADGHRARPETYAWDEPKLWAHHSASGRMRTRTWTSWRSCHTAALVVASIAPQTGSPWFSAKRASCARPENGQGLAGYADQTGVWRISLCYFQSW